MKDILKGLCEWLKIEKGITEIDLIDLLDYMPEYEEWLKTKTK